MAIILAVLFVVALTGLYVSIFHEEETAERRWFCYVLPGDDHGYFEYDSLTGEGRLWSVVPNDWEDWTRPDNDLVYGVYTRKFTAFPAQLDYRDNCGDIVVELSANGCREISYDPWF